MRKSFLFSFLLFLFSISVFSQRENLSQVWPAKWILPELAPSKEYSVCHFRKTIQLDSIPNELIVHTSGDNRYQLFVNGELVTWGPLTGDLRHWYYETTNITKYLHKGKNVIAAIVLNYGSHPPDARLSIQTGFLLAADDKKFRFLNTNNSWKAIYDSAYTPSMVDKTQINGYYGGGSREIFDGRKYIWNFEKNDFDDSYWQTAKEIENAYARTCIWASRWKLTPRSLKLEELKPQRFTSVRLAEGVSIPSNFPSEKTDILISPKTKARFILDNSIETTAYPVLIASKGKDAVIKMIYCEAPYIDKPNNKGNRDEVEGKIFIGYFDKIFFDGGVQRTYKPLWWRSYRYVVIEIETKDMPLIIHDISSLYSAYPFVLKSAFNVISSNKNIDTSLIQKIFDIGIRTTQLCSHETYIDCPYYEESQFEGDARVEMLVSYFNFGDPALAKNGIEQFAWSINDEGFLSARYPTNSLYYIPNFSIYWIGMLYDYMMYYNDNDFIQSKLQVSRSIIQYFLSLQRQDGTIKKPAYHNFIDWTFKDGEAPFDENGYSALVDLNVLQALQWAEVLERELGDTSIAQKYSLQIHKLSESIRVKYWSNEKLCFTDIPNGQALSQHTNCMAILTGVTSGDEAKKLMQLVLTNNAMTKATLYWSFYVNEALGKCGMGEEYLNNLEIWKEMISVGVSTWPETGANSRSECHGWGSSPNYHFFKNVAGIESLAPGFRKILIAPQFGDLKIINATIPHYLGTISINAQKLDAKHIKASIELPANTVGVFQWNGTEIQLKGGKQNIDF